MMLPTLLQTATPRSGAEKSPDGQESCWASAQSALQVSVNPAAKMGTVRYDDMALDADLYGFALKALLRNSFVLSTNYREPTSSRLYRSASLVSAFVLLYASIALQAALMYCTRQFMTGRAVWYIRRLYDTYESHMYGVEDNHYEITVGGNRRGLPQFFQPELFNTLDVQTKEDACSMPLSSMPIFLELIIFLWTLTCMQELRRCAELLQCLVWAPRETEVPFVELAFIASDEGHADGDVIYVRGIRRTAKAVIMVLILLPRVLITGLLLWLGCYWLMATHDMQSLILNGVALAFVKDIKNLMYTALVSAADKRELELTRCEWESDMKYQRLGLWTFSQAYLWAGMAVAFVWAYIVHLQNVLPDYRWDLAKACQGFIDSRDRGSAILV